MLSREDLVSIMPHCVSKVDDFVDPLNATMDLYEINTPARQAAFIAQIAHESLSLKYTEEIASGRAYEGRSDLGNTEPGDGPRFKGHGLIQNTGRENHQKYADFKGMTIDEVLAYLQTPDGACDVSGWFWKKHGLNELADVGDFTRITRRINGGTNGIEDRRAYWLIAKDTLGVA